MAISGDAPIGTQVKLIRRTTGNYYLIDRERLIWERMPEFETITLPAEMVGKIVGVAGDQRRFAVEFSIKLHFGAEKPVLLLEPGQLDYSKGTTI